MKTRDFINQVCNPHGLIAVRQNGSHIIYKTPWGTIKPVTSHNINDKVANRLEKEICEEEIEFLKRKGEIK